MALVTSPRRLVIGPGIPPSSDEVEAGVTKG